ncbi:MAG: PAS domain-containing protein [Chloroflexi bacterium]|nr:PAS domain-containing protein [Chloroflexota bacterium]
MRRFSVRAKLLASFTLVLLPVLGLLIYGYREANEQRVETILDNQMQTAQAVAALVDANFDEAFALAWALTNDPLVYTLDPSRLDPHLERLAPYYPQYETISIVNTEGDNVGSSLPFTPDVQRLRIATDRPYFQQLMATGEPVISPVLVSRRTFRPTIIVVVPLRAEQGKTIGAVLITLYLEALSHRLEGVALRPEQNILLADNTGTMAFHTGLPELPWEERNLGEFEPVKEALKGRPTEVRHFASPLLGEARIGAFTPTPKYGWVVGVTVREDAALAPVITALRDQLLGFGAIAILTLGLALASSRRLLQPIRRLTDQARALGLGDLSRRVAIETGDEMEVLGITFNHMAERLERTLTDLRAVLDATESGILMYDRDSVIRLLNRRMTDWFDLDPAQVIGQPFNVVCRDFVAPKLDQPAKLLARLDWLVAHPEETILEEIEMVRPEYRVLRLYVGPVRANGERIGYIDVFTDITELRRREEERQALGQIAEALVGELELERVADVVVEQAQRVFRTKTAELFLADPQREELRLIAHRGLSARTVAEISIAPFRATLLSALAARTGELQTVCDSTTLGPELALARRLAEREGQRSMFSQPLFARGRLVGVVTLAPK